MSRSVNHVASKARRKKILNRTKGYFGKRKNVWTVAKNTWEKVNNMLIVIEKLKKGHLEVCGLPVSMREYANTAYLILPLWAN